MPKLSIDLLKQDRVYLVISCLVFPLSKLISMACFTCFLAMRILFFDSDELKHPESKLSRSIKIALSVAIAIAMANFYWQSRSHFYPASYYDYLLVLITILVIRIYPLKLQHIQQVYSALSFSPLIVFIIYLPTLNFNLRNHWGFDNPNWLGFYCSICIPLIFCRLLALLVGSDIKFSTRQKVERTLLILSTFSLLACSIMMISSGSRSCLYTSAFIIILILYLKEKSLRRSPDKCQTKLQINSKTVAILIGSLLIFSLLYQFVFTKFVFLGRFINLSNSTNIYRIKIYQCYIQYGLEKPWWGWGFNKTATLCEDQLNAKYAGVNHAHNFILQLFTDGGLVVTLICLVSMIYLIIIPSLIFIFNYNFTSDSSLYLGIHLSSLTMIIISLFQSAFYHYPLFPLWLGLLWGFQLTPRKTANNTTNF